MNRGKDSQRKLLILLISSTLTGLLSSGCATFGANRGTNASEETAAEIPPTPKELREIQKLSAELKAKLDALESRMGSLNDKIDATKISVDNVMGARAAQATPVKPIEPHPASAHPAPPEAASDPELGMSRDVAIASYREAQLLFEAGRYSDALLGFSQFLEKYADHPLAGTAQFHVGTCYLRQKEYRLASQEFQRVLTAYDRSPAVPETLLNLSVAEEALKLSDQAKRHRQQLLALYPQSPAADGVSIAAPPPLRAAAEAVPAEKTAPVAPTAPVPQLRSLDPVPAGAQDHEG